MDLPLKTNKPVVLVAEDDADDRLLLTVILNQDIVHCELRFVQDGEELMDYLLRRNGHPDEDSPRPGLILLDLNMPRKDGRQALVEIRSHQEFRDIPVVIWTTSRVEDDKLFCAEAGASDYVSKPDSFLELEKDARAILKNWLK